MGNKKYRHQDRTDRTADRTIRVPQKFKKGASSTPAAPDGHSIHEQKF